MGHDQVSILMEYFVPSFCTIEHTHVPGTFYSVLDTGVFRGLD